MARGSGFELLCLSLLYQPGLNFTWTIDTVHSGYQVGFLHPTLLNGLAQFELNNFNGP